VQVDPIKPKSKPPGTKRLKLQCDILPSTTALKSNLHHYTKELPETLDETLAMLERMAAGGRGLYSFTSQRGPRRKPGASSYTPKRLPLSLSLSLSIFLSFTSQVNLSHFCH
jgi:hypothetical protein